eukprot:GHVS01053487.1.p1 GENE.GHVS01053487.1~~GHVS01053487.1.p1  ORF type:complete len:483 (+),score=50.80 GHVS01053487.1:60-1451(+)
MSWHLSDAASLLRRPMRRVASSELFSLPSTSGISSPLRRLSKRLLVSRRFRALLLVLLLTCLLIPFLLPLFSAPTYIPPPIPKPSLPKPLAPISLIVPLTFQDASNLDLFVQSLIEQTILPKEVIFTVSAVPHKALLRPVLQQPSNSTSDDVSFGSNHVLAYAIYRRYVQALRSVVRTCVGLGTGKVGWVMAGQQGPTKLAGGAECLRLRVFVREGIHFSGDNRMLGFSKSTEDIVTFFDSDDIMSPNRTEILLKIFQNHHKLEALLHGFIPCRECDNPKVTRDWDVDWSFLSTIVHHTTNSSSSTKQPFPSLLYLSGALPLQPQLPLSFQVPPGPWKSVTFPHAFQRRMLAFKRERLRLPTFRHTFKQIQRKLPRFGRKPFEAPNIPGTGMWAFPMDMDLVDHSLHNGWVTIRRRVVEVKGVEYDRKVRRGQDSLFNWRMIKSKVNFNYITTRLGLYVFKFL